jgi:hypothetical protein
VPKHGLSLFQVIPRCVGSHSEWLGSVRPLWHTRDPRPRVYLHKTLSGEAEIPFAGSDGAGPVSLGSGEAESAASGSAKPGPIPLGSGESEAFPSGSDEADFSSRGRIRPFHDP